MNFHLIFDFGRLRLEWERGACRLIRWYGPRWWALQNLGDGWTLETLDSHAREMAELAA